MSTRRPVVLSIAGSDSSGAAGLQADLKTCAALETYAACVVTAVTAQGLKKVGAVHPLPTWVVEAQLQTVLEDMQVDAFKTGLLGSAATVEMLCGRLEEMTPANLVVDPVLEAGSGEPLLTRQAMEVLRRRLLPLATVVTPNLPEAESLLGRTGLSVPEMTGGIRALGAQAVLLKGGHASGHEVVDHLDDGKRIHEFRRPRLKTDCSRGTGCTLSAAMAAYLARGLPLAMAVQRAGDFVHRGLETAWSLGAAGGPLHHFHALWGPSCDS